MPDRDVCAALFLPVFLYLPVGDGVLLGVEVDGHLDDGAVVEGEACGVVLAVHLVHGGPGRLVQFELKEVERPVCAQHHVHAAGGRAHLDVDKVARDEGEDDVEHLLVVAFAVGVVAVGDGEEEVAEQGQRTVYVAKCEALCHASCRIVHHEAVGRDVRGDERACQADAHLLVGNVEGIEVEVLVIVLDGDVAALVE